MILSPIILPKLMPRDGAAERIARIVKSLPQDMAVRIEFHEHKPRRSDAQNRLLWSLYQQIIDKGGEAMRGWRKDEIHDFMLGEWAGWDRVEMFGRVKMRPLRRSSRLNKQDFGDFLAFIATLMADHGIYLEMPDEEAAA